MGDDGDIAHGCIGCIFHFLQYHSKRLKLLSIYKTYNYYLIKK